MIEVIIFDLDGLMVDSEPFHQKAFDKVFKEYGKELTVEDNNKYYVGTSDVDASRDMVKRFSLPITPELLLKKKQVVYKELVSIGIIAQDGLMELLEKLHENNFRKAIASGSMLEEIKLLIDSLKINQYIENFFSAEQVEHGKPAPDLFLLVAKEMGVEPSECLVLEDAPNGINAAKSAGMALSQKN